MNRLFIIFFITVLYLGIVAFSFAGETVRQYDSNHNITGYTVIEDGRETHFDKNWNRTGYSKDDSHYNNQHDRTGKTVWDGDTGTAYDKDHNRTGHLKKQDNKIIMYDKNWKREGYKK